MINLISRISADINQDLVCGGGEDSKCQLIKPCSSAEYTDLWTYYVKIQFHFAGPYTTVNFGSFAVDNTTSGTCDLYVTHL